jgi:hypothetical protein
MKTILLSPFSLACLLSLLCPFGWSKSPPPLDIPPNTWTRIEQQNYGARRFSSFRYAEEIDAFLSWGFHAFESWYRGSPAAFTDGLLPSRTIVLG